MVEEWIPGKVFVNEVALGQPTWRSAAETAKGSAWR